MTQEQYIRAQKINKEIESLKPVLRELETYPPVSITIGETTIKHTGLRETIDKYVNNRIEELEKEFNEL